MNITQLAKYHRIRIDRGIDATFTNSEHRNGCGSITSLEVTGDITWKRSIRRNSVDPSDGTKPGTHTPRLRSGVSAKTCWLAFLLPFVNETGGYRAQQLSRRLLRRGEKRKYRVYRAGVIEGKSHRGGSNFSGPNAAATRKSEI